jgi:hypothetical protein
MPRAALQPQPSAFDAQRLLRELGIDLSMGRQRKTVLEYPAWLEREGERACFAATSFANASHQL